MSEEYEEKVEQPDHITDDMRQRWCCEDCDLTVTVWTSDPYYPDAVNCPECGSLTEYVGDEHEW
jgi:hypothetical protein